MLPDATQSFTLTVNQATRPAITSATSTTFTVGTAGSFTVTTTGFPTPTLSETGALPSGVTFTDNGNGTATLSGTPTADRDLPPDLHRRQRRAPQRHPELHPDGQPGDPGAGHHQRHQHHLHGGHGGHFTVTTTGFPTPTLSETGPCPAA